MISTICAAAGGLLGGIGKYRACVGELAGRCRLDSRDWMKLDAIIGVGGGLMMGPGGIFYGVLARVGDSGPFLAAAGSVVLGVFGGYLLTAVVDSMAIACSEARGVAGGVPR